jgi:hypothetical protein
MNEIIGDFGSCRPGLDVVADMLRDELGILDSEQRDAIDIDAMRAGGDAVAIAAEIAVPYDNRAAVPVRVMPRMVMSRPMVMKRALSLQTLPVMTTPGPVPSITKWSLSKRTQSR